MFSEFYVFGERVIGWVRGGGGGVRNISSPLRGVLNIFRRFWGMPNFMVEFWNTLHPSPPVHILYDRFLRQSSKIGLGDLGPQSRPNRCQVPSTEHSRKFGGVHDLFSQSVICCCIKTPPANASSDILQRCSEEGNSNRASRSKTMHCLSLVDAEGHQVETKVASHGGPPERAQCNSPRRVGSTKKEVIAQRNMHKSASLTYKRRLATGKITRFSHALMAKTFEFPPRRLFPNIWRKRKLSRRKGKHDLRRANTTQIRAFVALIGVYCIDVKPIL